MNQHYIQQLNENEYFEKLKPFLVDTPYATGDEDMLRKVCKAVQPALVTLRDIGEHVALFYRPEDKPLDQQVIEQIKNEESKQVFRAFREIAEKESVLDKDVFMTIMKAVQAETKIKGKSLWAPMRSAITLEAEGPDLYMVVEILGRDKTLERIDRALNL